MNDVDRGIQDALYRDAARQAADLNPMFIPLQVTDRVNDEQAQLERLLPEAAERHKALQKEGAYNIQILQTSQISWRTISAI